MKIHLYASETKSWDISSTFTAECVKDDGSLPENGSGHITEIYKDGKLWCKLPIYYDYKPLNQFYLYVIDEEYLIGHTYQYDFFIYKDGEEIYHDRETSHSQRLFHIENDIYFLKSNSTSYFLTLGKTFNTVKRFSRCTILGNIINANTYFILNSDLYQGYKLLYENVRKTSDIIPDHLIVYFNDWSSVVLDKNNNECLRYTKFVSYTHNSNPLPYFYATDNRVTKCISDLYTDDCRVIGKGFTYNSNKCWIKNNKEYYLLTSGLLVTHYIPYTKHNDDYMDLIRHDTYITFKWLPDKNKWQHKIPVIKDARTGLYWFWSKKNVLELVDDVDYITLKLIKYEK